MKSISIKPKSNGYVFDIGEKGYIFDSPQEIINELQRYFDDPEAVEQEYEQGTVSPPDPDPIEETGPTPDPDPVDLTAPDGLSVDNTDTLRPTFTWSAVTGADSYLIHASQGSVMTIDATVTDNAFIPDEDLPEGEHHWRVRAMAGETIGPWSAIQDITIGTVQDPEPTPDPDPVSGSTADDINALEALYSATNGSSWDNNTGWSSTGMSLNAYGVETATIDGEERVTSLNLKDNNLSGTLPSEIGNLTAMTYFNVHFNSITGQIPASIGNLTQLEYLYLNVSDRTESRDYDPHEHVTMGAGDFHPGKLPTSGAVGEYYNLFSGEVPSSIGNLSKLKWFTVDWCNLTELPTTIFDLTNLEGLELSNNKWNDIHFGTGFHNLNNLTHLAITNMYHDRSIRTEGNLVGNWSDIFGEGILPNLHSVRISSNPGITGSMGKIESNNLRNFIAGRNNISGPFPASLVDGSKDLVTCLVTWPLGTGWTGELPEFASIGLAQFNIPGHSMEGEIPASLFHNNPGIIDMNFRDNIFTSVGTSDLTGLYQIRNIRWQDNNISGKWPNLDWDNPSKLEDMKFVEFGGNNYSSADKSYIPAGQSKTIFQLYNELDLDHFWY